MKTKSTLLRTFCILSLFTTVNGAIAWIDPSGTNSNSYTANDTLVLRSDLNHAYGSWGNITMDFTSTLDGTVSFSNSVSVSNGQIQFTAASAIAANGGTATFSFDFHELLNSGSKYNRDGSSLGDTNARSAAMFLIDRTDLDVAMQVTRVGGGTVDERNLEGHFAAGDAPASTGDTDHIVAGTFTYDSDGGRSTFQSVSGDVAQFTEGNLTSGSNARILLYDTSRYHSNGPWNFQFQELEFQVTNEDTSEIPAGTRFLFTFEGVSATEAPVVPVPEPSSALLASLGAIAVLLKRGRKS